MVVVPTAADEQDILVVQDAGDAGRLVTGNVDVSVTPPAFVLPNRVFVTELTEVFAGIDDLRGDEGFFAVSDPNDLPAGYTTLDGSVDIRFDFVSFPLGCRTANLWVWPDPADGGEAGFADDIAFEPVSAPITLSFTKAPSTFFTATVDGSAQNVPGFTIDRTSDRKSVV